MPVFQFKDAVPAIADTAYIADSANIIGRVIVGAYASIWFNVTARGDNETIRIGDYSNLQEGVILHTDLGYPLDIAENVTIGHQAMLHGCSVGAGSLVGIQAVVLNGARIGNNCLVGAGALVTEGKAFPNNTLILGSPAKVARLLSQDEINHLHNTTAQYVIRGQEFKKQLKRIG